VPAREPIGRSAAAPTRRQSDSVPDRRRRRCRRAAIDSSRGPVLPTHLPNSVRGSHLRVTASRSLRGPHNQGCFPRPERRVVSRSRRRGLAVSEARCRESRRSPRPASCKQPSSRVSTRDPSLNGAQATNVWMQKMGVSGLPSSSHSQNKILRAWLDGMSRAERLAPPCRRMSSEPGRRPEKVRPRRPSRRLHLGSVRASRPSSAAPGAGHESVKGWLLVQIRSFRVKRPSCRRVAK
jgi:hypothetical protein